MATFGLSGLRLGPDQRTGMTPSRVQVATFSPPMVMAVMVAVCRSTRFAKLHNQAVSFALSLPTARLSLMLGYLIRVRQLPDESVISALLALLDHDLEAEPLTC